MKISVNGEATETGFATLGELAATEFGISTPKGIALAVNESVVPNSEWNSFSIKEGDKILVVQATQGG